VAAGMIGVSILSLTYSLEESNSKRRRVMSIFFKRVSQRKKLEESKSKRRRMISIFFKPNGHLRLRNPEWRGRNH